MANSFAIPIAIGVLTIILNIAQLWCLHKHFRRHVNPLMVIIFHLSVADLVVGISAIPTCIFMILKEKLFVGSSLLIECVDVLQQVNRFLSSVSIITLATLTVLKMLRVTQNEWLTKLTIKRICRTIWIVVLVCFSIEYVVYKAHGYSDDVELVAKYRRLWLPLQTFPAAIIIVYCFARMFCVMRMRQVQTTQESVERRRRFLTIAILHLVGFIVCAAPLAVLNLLDVVIQIDPVKIAQLHPKFVFLLMGNPLVDSIGFLIVYRRKLRGRRPRRVVGLRASPPQRPPVRLKDILVQDNPVLDDDRGVKESCGEIAVLCNTATSLPCSSSTSMSTNKQRNREPTMKHLVNQSECVTGIKQVDTAT